MEQIAYISVYRSLWREYLTNSITQAKVLLALEAFKNYQEHGPVYFDDLKASGRWMTRYLSAQGLMRWNTIGAYWECI